MNDFRELILGLTSSQRDAAIDVERAAQIVSESASYRKELGGTLGVEAGKGKDEIF